MGRRLEDELGRELYRQRPSPSDEYVVSLARAVRGSRRSTRTGRRIALAIVLSLAALIALSAAGGVTQSTAAPQSVATVVKNLVTHSSSSIAKTVHSSAAQDQYAEKCNSGRGNGSEGDSSQLIDPHNGGTGPGQTPTVDCDPGNSGGVNHGGD
jgi:hypothetical protein